MLMCKPDKLMAINETALRNEAVRRIRGVIDPEVGISIVDLGLLYQVYMEDQVLKVHITVTTPGCPIRRYIEQQVMSVLSDLVETELHVVMDPPWSANMIAENIHLFDR